MIDRVDVHGIRELQSALRQVDRSLPRQLRVAGNRAAEVIRADAQRRASTKLERAAAGRLKLSSQQRSVAVTLGSARHPEDLGAEFGADRTRPRRTRRGTVRGWAQFRPWRGSGRNAGYFLYPAIRARGDEVLRVYQRELDQLIDRAGL